MVDTLKELAASQSWTSSSLCRAEKQTIPPQLIVLRMQRELWESACSCPIASFFLPSRLIAKDNDLQGSVIRIKFV